MAIKELLEQNTDVVELATSLLATLDDITGQYVWKQLTAEGGDFIAFVTADAENAYPNGGTQDGYWYELVEEGAVGVAIGEVILTADSSSLTIEHNFGTLPTFGLVAALTEPSSNSSAVAVFKISGLGTMGHCKTNNGIVGAKTASLNMTEISMTASAKTTLGATAMFTKGITYKWIVGV